MIKFIWFCAAIFFSGMFLSCMHWSPWWLVLPTVICIILVNIEE